MNTIIQCGGQEYIQRARAEPYSGDLTGQEVDILQTSVDFYIDFRQDIICSLEEQAEDVKEGEIQSAVQQGQGTRAPCDRTSTMLKQEFLSSPACSASSVRKQKRRQEPLEVPVNSPNSVENSQYAIPNGHNVAKNDVAKNGRDTIENSQCSQNAKDHEPADDERRQGTEACSACGRTAAELGIRKLLKCSACTIEPLYCSAECQRACWNAHKAACKANRKASK
jgi:hypothetical protein